MLIFRTVLCVLLLRYLFLFILPISKMSGLGLMMMGSECVYGIVCDVCVHKGDASRKKKSEENIKE